MSSFISGGSLSTYCCELGRNHNLCQFILDNQHRSSTCALWDMYSCTDAQCGVHLLYIQNKVLKWVCISLLRSFAPSHRCNCIRRSPSREWASFNINHNIHVCTKKANMATSRFFLHSETPTRCGCSTTTQSQRILHSFLKTFTEQ